MSGDALQNTLVLRGLHAMPAEGVLLAETSHVDCVLSLGMDTGESTGAGHFLTKEIN